MSENWGSEDDGIHYMESDEEEKTDIPYDDEDEMIREISKAAWKLETERQLRQKERVNK